MIARGSWRPGASARISAMPRGAKAGAIALLALTAIAVLGPLLAPHDPTRNAGLPLLSPGQHGLLLGSDDLGRDMLSRTLTGLRTSWLSALAVVAVGLFAGGLIGLAAGVAGGWLDALLMRVTDAALALPGAMLAVAVVVALGPSLTHTLLAVSLVWWPWYARIVRGEARALIVRPHVDAARLAGAGRARLALVHVLPGVVAPLVIVASVDLGGLVLTLAALSFIGLGAPPPAPELGAMTAGGLQYLLGHPWVAVVPAVTVALLAATANLAGDGLRRLLPDD
jgi:peptide/nickel transport system permease protein